MTCKLLITYLLYYNYPHYYILKIFAPFASEFQQSFLLYTAQERKAPERIFQTSQAQTAKLDTDLF